MRNITLIIAVLISLTLKAQLTEKELRKLEQYEFELKNGDIYKADKKADKLIKKHPNEFAVIDFKIRCIQQKYLESLQQHESSIVNLTSRVVREIYYRELIELIQKEFQLDPENSNACLYIDFLHKNGDEQPFDSGDTRTLSEMHHSELKELDINCH